MNRITPVALGIASLLTLIPRASEALVILDQDNSPPPFSVIFGDSLLSFNQIAQTFTVGRSGILDSIDVSLGVDEGAAGDVVFSLLPTQFGVPQNTLPLFQTNIPANTLQDFSLNEPFSLSVDVSSAGLFVQPGEEYAWAMTRTVSTASDIFVNSAGSYDGGDPYRRSSDIAAWTIDGSTDRLFRTFVDTDATSGSSTIAPSVAANVDLDNELNEYVVALNPFSLVTNQRPSSSVDDRAILEFPLSSIPTNTVLTSAKLNLDVSLFTTGGGEFADVPLFGYEGDGLTSADDAAVTTNFLGSTGPIESGDPISVELSLDYVEELVSTGSTLGIAMIGSANRFQAGFDNFTSPPSLTLEYDFVIPGDFNRDGTVDAADYTVWRDTEGQTGPGLAADANGDQTVDGLDYDEWVSNFGESLESAQSVPEPSGALLLAAAGWVLLTPPASLFAVRRSGRV